MERRVVITGMGAITPVGNNVNDFWTSIKDGVCGINKITRFDTTDFKVDIAAEVKNFDATDYMDKKEARRMDRYCHYAMAASEEAINDSGLNLDDIDRDRFGVIIGSGVGGLETQENQTTILNESGPNRVSPFMVPMMIANMAAGHVSIKYGLKGPSSSIVTACASGTHSIGEAFRNIKYGYADYMLCGGAEATITRLAVAGFINITALTKNPDPKDASKPFDLNRDGFVLGEGSGIVILEDYEHAISRGAKIYAEVLGYGSTSDAYHMTAPEPEGKGAARAIKIALEEGKIQPEQVSYINAHGTSTTHNDRTETMAIKKALGDAAYKIPVSSTKGMTGHLLGAAGAIEAIVCAMAIKNSYIPATIGLKTPDPECNLDYVPNEGRNSNVEYVLSNSLGFGGHNGTLLLGKVQ